jgi:gluconokinase
MATLRAIVVMGVSGSGKSTLGRSLAAELNYSFIEGDEIHPPANIAKMAVGIALDDIDRQPWLQAVAVKLAEAVESGGGVAACSALKRSYRDVLRDRLGNEMLFVHLVISREVVLGRHGLRQGHFMPASLIDSQFAALEPPGADELSIEVAAALTTEHQIAEIVSRLGASYGY